MMSNLSLNSIVSTTPAHSSAIPDSVTINILVTATTDDMILHSSMMIKYKLWQQRLQDSGYSKVMLQKNKLHYQQNKIVMFGP